MKHTSLIFGLLASVSLTAQNTILAEDFNTAMPGWQQTPATTWTLSPGFGVSGSDCIATYADFAETHTITTSALNLTGYTTFTISFDAALVKNNFMEPDIVLWYDAGSGPQFLARWGSGYTSGTTYTLTGTSEFGPHLQASNVSWQPCTHAFGPVSGNTSAVQFIVEGDMFNGGYVLLDNILISGTMPITTGITQQSSDPKPSFANPVKNKQLVLSHAEKLKEAVLFNSVGQQLLSKEWESADEELQMSLESLPGGLYILGLRMEDNRWITSKIVVE